MAIQPDDPNDKWTDEDTKLVEEKISQIKSYSIDAVTVLLSFSSMHRPCGQGCKACLYHSKIIQALGSRLVEIGKEDEQTELRGLSRESN